MKKIYKMFLLVGMLALTLCLAPYQAKASQTSPAESQASIDAPASNIETVPADDVPIEQAPSSKNSNDTMQALLEFVVLWSIIYIVIKLVRKKLEKDRPLK